MRTMTLERQGRYGAQSVATRRGLTQAPNAAQALKGLRLRGWESRTNVPLSISFLHATFWGAVGWAVGLSFWGFLAAVVLEGLTISLTLAAEWVETRRQRR